MKAKLRVLLYRLVQLTWGLPQTLVGAFVFLLTIRRPHYVYHGAIVTAWKQGGSVSLGMFLFVSGRNSREKNHFNIPIWRQILVHEYGHSVQSLVLGPLYLLVIGLPSIVWAGLPALSRMRRRKEISYYDFYPERWANAWGEKVTKEPSMGRARLY